MPILHVALTFTAAWYIALSSVMQTCFFDASTIRSTGTCPTTENGQHQITHSVYHDTDASASTVSRKGPVKETTSSLGVTKHPARQTHQCHCQLSVNVPALGTGG
ncbi:hypothetical protein EDC04DRAFT_2190109 [Pisolithus marmoratus]|nr:hypothetical protein EDC04DRAFT_2190109 [Pisolithus marmoratus]